NSEIMVVLLDLDSGPNTNHVKNPLKTKYLPANFVSDTISPGIGKDNVYRDPWGNPYIITIDLNYNEKARDAFYGQEKISHDSGQTGFYGLQNTKDTTGMTDYFEANDKVMVWSAGPDKKI